MTTATKPKRIKNLFPKISRGGFTVRLRFQDETRGEMYFDSEWDTHDRDVSGRFAITFPVDYRGNIIHDRPSINSIGRQIRVGDLIHVEPTKWTTRGRRPLAGRTVRITSVVLNQETGFTELSYE